MYKLFARNGVHQGTLRDLLDPTTCFSLALSCYYFLPISFMLLSKPRKTIVISIRFESFRNTSGGLPRSPEIVSWDILTSGTISTQLGIFSKIQGQRNRYEVSRTRLPVFTHRLCNRKSDTASRDDSFLTLCKRYRPRDATRRPRKRLKRN